MTATPFLCFLAGLLTASLLLHLPNLKHSDNHTAAAVYHGDVLVALNDHVPWSNTSHAGVHISKQLHFKRPQFLPGDDNDDEMAGLLTWAVAELEPAGATGRHVHHDVVEIFHVVEGHCRVVVDARPDDLLLGKGDSFAVLPETHHDVQNDSRTQKLRLVYAMVRFGGIAR